ncbi:acyl-CoA dehydrogenase family protein [Paraburkholderia silvatlantica]|uniref:Alkylation response protein AidB-like acyl-CoA dehydrogenase n=1 Tax=Paraburkholderia silvatlantica TaxID=321895 RepID=A0ABR6FH65_9BURK|nr:acyl-CoA dehydrogenase family protein [Paraburkholderia silvatlantica]MBB2926738.1 alkylation response protein AidB-like acyl-CoA dehydrogenase [Paraburkholderia silvatlantica]PVY37634.1 alkylation response protein AidB-like acyl-CoA dehydrogenase [Paraburkholderia silvatlantica]PXW42596.1 alkylation response protein AidB-like acyl-CoA dehydrogenase [Paraburkholderia silvatlantica]
MSSLRSDDTLSTGADYEALAARFLPVFAEIARDAVERDRARSLPHEAIALLKKAGFGAVRVPARYGGAGASIEQLFRLIIELASADSNLPQALRGHFAFVEDWLNAPADEDQRAWFDRFVGGQLVGNAWTEAGDVALGQINTKVSRRDGAFVLNGAKYYSTGSLYADWIDVFAQREDDGSDVIVAVNVHQPGVIREDDWDGFGQTTTGSGTTLFRDAEVQARNVVDFSRRFKYQTAFYQLFHVATLAGIAQAAQRDAAALVRSRKRVYSHGNAGLASDDVQIQQVVGEIASWAYGARAVTLQAAQAVQRAYEAHFGGNDEAERAANVEAEIASAQSQLVASEFALRGATHLFDALGASAIRADHALDRHWRNARAVSSHNPLVYKAKIVGDWIINGTQPPFVWHIGNGPKRGSQ